MKQDQKLVSSKEDYEISYIAAKFKCHIKVVRAAMLEAGKNGKPARSRKVIYKALREKGYQVGGFQDTEKTKTTI